MTKVSNNQIDEAEVDDRSKIAEGSLQNGEMTQFYFKTLIELELALSLVIVVNIYLIVIEADKSFPSLLEQNASSYTTCQYFSCACVLISILLVCMRSITVLKLEKQQKRIYQKATLLSTNKLLYLLFEVFILILQPYPFFQGQSFQTTNAYTGETIQFPLNDILTILSIARIYVLFRTALELTPYMTNRSNRLCKMYGCRADFSFSLKCMFRDNPLSLICALFASSAIIFAYLIYVAERQLATQNGTSYKRSVCNNYLNSLWLILITITTVGYGDYYPQTPLGRIIILFVAIWGTFIVSIMVVVVSNMLNMEKSELRTSKVLIKLHLRTELKKRAQQFIGRALLYFLKNKSRQNMKALLRAQNTFVEQRKEIKNIAEYDDIQDQVASHFLKLNTDIDILNTNQTLLIEFIQTNFNYRNADSQTEDPSGAKSVDQISEANEDLQNSAKSLFSDSDSEGLLDTAGLKEDEAFILELKNDIKKLGKSQ